MVACTGVGDEGRSVNRHYGVRGYVLVVVARSAETVRSHLLCRQHYRQAWQS